MRWLVFTVFFILAFPVNAVLYVLHNTELADPFNRKEIPAEENPTTALAMSDIKHQNERVPDFSAFHDTRQKKRVFFEFMLPLIREANASIREERSELIALSRKLETGLVLSRGEYLGLGQLFKRYRFDMPVKVEAHDVDELLHRVDTIPASLVLAQSAHESAWGTSRFATEANNFFGIWCFSRGCGVEPKERSTGLTHEIAAYESVQEGINAYLRNINTHSAYEDLRIIRAEQHSLQNPSLQENVIGILLAAGLKSYSARGVDYVREIQQMIRTNKLSEFTFAVNPFKA